LKSFPSGKRGLPPVAEEEVGEGGRGKEEKIEMKMVLISFWKENRDYQTIHDKYEKL